MVMGVVISIGSKRGRGNSVVIRVQVQRLYQLEELVRIIDGIAPYRCSSKLRTIQFGDEAPPSDADPEILLAHAQYLANKRKIEGYFCPDPVPVERHAVLITIMSDHVAYLYPKNIHKVMHATVNPAILA